MFSENFVDRNWKQMETVEMETATERDAEDKENQNRKRNEGGRIF